MNVYHKMNFLPKKQWSVYYIIRSLTQIYEKTRNSRKRRIYLQVNVENYDEHKILLCFFFIISVFCFIIITICIWILFDNCKKQIDFRNLWLFKLKNKSLYIYLLQTFFFILFYFKHLFLIEINSWESATVERCIHVIVIIILV